MPELSAKQLNRIERKHKSDRIYDTGGLYLEVPPASKPKAKPHWRFRYKLNKKENRISLGAFPLVTLSQARRLRDEKRALLVEGRDPSGERKARKAEAEQAQVQVEHTFEVVARMWMAGETNWKDATRDKVTRRLEKEIFPHLGHRPIHDISAPDLLQCLRLAEARGIYETVHRLRNYCENVFAYGLGLGLNTGNPAVEIRRNLKKIPEVTHQPALTEPTQVAALLRAIDGYTGSNVVRLALQLLPLVFVRSSEFRHAVWSEVNFELALWEIPGERMKGGKADYPHLVPLSRQALALLRELCEITGPGGFVFPSTNNNVRPMSENTINAALARLDYKGVATGHGFRTTASTLLNEQGWNHDWIERQLAHIERNKVRGAYNKAQYLEGRIDLPPVSVPVGS